MQNALLLLGGWALFNSFFAALYLFFHKSVKENEANKLLGVFFLALAFKSVYPALCAHQTDLWCTLYYRWAIMCYMLLGPILLLYVHTFVVRFFIFRKLYLLLGVVPVLIWLLPNDWLYHSLRFYTSQAWMFIFLGLAGWQIRKQNKKEHGVLWLRVLVCGTFIIGLSALSKQFVELLALGGLATLGFFYILIEKKEIVSYPKVETSTLSTQKIEHDTAKYRELAQEIEQQMQKEKLYLDSKLSLAVLAEEVQQPLHEVSRTINEQFRKSYPEYVNSYRIAEAKQRLQNDKNCQHNIASIAYDCGFSSLSTFNTAFKRFTKTTPSVYRKNLISSDLISI